MHVSPPLTGWLLDLHCLTSAPVHQLTRALQAVEERVAGLERAARTAVQQEAELRAWLEAPDGSPPHIGEAAQAPAANGGVARRHTADEDDSEVGRKPLPFERHSLPSRCQAAGTPGLCNMQTSVCSVVNSVGALQPDKVELPVC